MDFKKLFEKTLFWTCWRKVYQILGLMMNVWKPFENPFLNLLKKGLSNTWTDDECLKTLWKPFFELTEERFIKYLDWWWKFDLSSGTYFFHKQTSSTKTSDFISSFPWMKECQHPFSKAPKKKNNLFDIQQRKRKKYQMVLILKEMKVAILKQ